MAANAPVRLSFGSAYDISFEMSKLFESYSDAVGQLGIQFAIDQEEVRARAKGTSASGRVTESEVKKEFQQQMYWGAYALAQSAQSTIQKWLAPRGESNTSVDIGWTGTASRNIMMNVQENGQGAYGIIYEGGLTRANKQIREGRDPGSAEDDIDTLKKWAKYRAIKYRFSGVGGSKEEGGHFSIPRKYRGRGRKTATPDYWTTRLAYRIRTSLKLLGASERYKTRFGSRKFDYIKRYIARGDAKQAANALQQTHYLPPGYVEGTQGKFNLELLGDVFFAYTASEMGKAHQQGTGMRQFKYSQR